MKHLDAGESDGCALIQVVVLPMQAAGSARHSKQHGGERCFISHVNIVFFFPLGGVKGFPVVHDWLRAFADI